MVDYIEAPSAAVGDGESVVFDGTAGTKARSSGAVPVNVSDGVITSGLACLFETMGDAAFFYEQRKMHWMRIGDRVFFDLYMIVTPTYSTAGGAFFIEGLPYPAAPMSAVASGYSLSSIIGGIPFGSSTWASLVARIEPGTDRIRIVATRDGSQVTYINSNRMVSGNEVRVQVGGSYPVA